MTPLKLSQNAVNWLANGKRGISSNTIFTIVTGVDAADGWTNHPGDPSDFIRCENLLRACPEIRAGLHKMREVSPVWARLVDNWDAIIAAILEDIPEAFSGGEGRASKASRLMQQIIENRYAYRKPAPVVTDLALGEVE